MVREERDVKVLLDTHALVWWLEADRRVSPTVRNVLGDPMTVAFISAVSGWEIATKVRIGKLQMSLAIVTDFPAEMARIGYHPLPVSLAHGHRAGGLSGPHMDPFDRMLAAQSLMENLPLITVDPAFQQFGVSTIW